MLNCSLMYRVIQGRYLLINLWARFWTVHTTLIILSISYYGGPDTFHFHIPHNLRHILDIGLTRVTGLELQRHSRYKSVQNPSKPLNVPHYRSSNFSIYLKQTLSIAIPPLQKDNAASLRNIRVTKGHIAGKQSVGQGVQ